MNKRYHAFVSGNVQGIGFRYTTQAFAHRYGLVGWVMNVSGGKVELEIEGNTNDANNFFSDLRGKFREHIRDIETAESAYTGAYKDFQIRFF